MTIGIDTVKTYCPAFYFHDNEGYFPCGIEHLLQGSVLKDRNDPGFSQPSPSQADLAAHPADNYYVSIAASQFAGDLAHAPIYYAVREYQDAVELHYLVLYAFQGGQTCRALRAGTEFNCIVKTLGMHQGDLEHVVVRLVPKSGGGYDVLQVGYEAHGDMHFYPTQRVAWEDGTHPVVNVALNGHSSQNRLVSGDRVTEFEQPGSVAIISALSGSGPSWRPYKTADFKLLGLDGSGQPIGDQVWASFRGRLGDSQDNTMDSATYFDGSNLSSLDWSFVKLTDWAARLFDKYPDDIKHGDGPNGPGGRDWVTPASGVLYGDQMIVLQHTEDMGQGPGAVAWLAGNVVSTGRTEIVQGWANHSSLGMIVYGNDGGSGLKTLWATGDMGQGPGAVAWLTGNFIGDERKEVVQCWANHSSLGMIVYGTDGQSGLKTLWSTDDMGQGPGAVAWLVGKFLGNGKDQIVQCWAHHSSLGMILYGSDGGSGLRTLWGTDDMGQGPGAVSWLVGDFNGDGRDEIAQCWGNGSRLGMIVYGFDGGSGLTTLWATGDMGQGPGAVAWLVGDFVGDGRKEIVQCWGNGSRLGMIVYGSDGGNGMKTLWATGDMGQGPGAVAWLVGNFRGDAKSEIVQCWGNGSSLGMILYGSDGGSGMKTLWATGDMGEGPGAVAWLTGNFRGDDRDEIVQCWGNGSSLGTIVYGTV
ncbi:FG-GAP repeat domain-containing protein [Mangrovibrevibacter kandeliae]|uniref:FG-GAP repeat domain-containing protein n=1 Tax=Mangrovibrevibacter kandeliae TaxID=2968473 RepID=UPI00211939A2|nr:VCBS repeat-containing protein [Aurantimonas sp. CSK15Z-1]MCQ8783245.1 VCBS repeat-containing protein [Aurantimonas sp. CSK15Z-1]